MLFEQAPIQLQIIAIQTCMEKKIFFKYSMILEQTNQYNFSEIVKLGNKRFKGRFLKQYNEYKKEHQKKKKIKT